MPFTGAHKEKEIDGVLCRLVEESISVKRMEFLKKLLEHNGFEVKVEENTKSEEDKGNAVKSYNLWVTDVLFNPVIYVYELRLKTPGNKIVTPAYWPSIGTRRDRQGRAGFLLGIVKKENRLRTLYPYLFIEVV